MPTRDRNLSTALASYGVSGAGKLFEMLQRGITADAMRDYAAASSRNIGRASGIFGRGSALAKGVGLASMFLLPPGVSTLARLAIGGGISGVGTKLAGMRATDMLNREDIEKYIEGGKLLYGRQKAMDLESDAFSAMDRLEESVNPSAIQNAITTPLTYLTMKNRLFNPYTQNPSTVTSGLTNIYNNPGLRLNGLPGSGGQSMNNLFGMTMGRKY